jgi:anti-sigma regulatory factor (Ser/Thr protein kinase)
MLNGRLVEEIERRQQDQKYRSLRVSVHLARTPDGLELTIRDQGDGFDWKKYLEYSEERAFDLHGRGIAMATHCFDSIEYKGSGNTVKVTISELRPAS